MEGPNSNAKRHKGLPSVHVDVEVRMRYRGSFTLGVEQAVQTFIKGKGTLCAETTWNLEGVTNSSMGEDVLAINIGMEGAAVAGEQLVLETAQYTFHDYVCSNQMPQQHEGDAPTNGEQKDADAVSAFSHYQLPSALLEGQWGSLIFDADVKSELLKYVRTAIAFSEAGVDTSIISASCFPPVLLVACLPLHAYTG